MDSATQLTVTADVDHPAAIAAGTTAAKIAHVGVGNHFEVIFADYKTDTTLDASAAGTDDMFKILSDQHGNAINASANNYIKGNNEISW